MLPKQLHDLQKFFQKFPGIGPRQASRFSFFLMKQNHSEIDKLINALENLKKDVSVCNECYMPTAKNANCTICTDTKRDKSALCIVEKESDAINMEDAGIYKGRYLVLGETISPIGESKTAKERLKKFTSQLKNDDDKKEVVLALNNTKEGNFTSMYIKKLFDENLEEGKVKITRLGRGLSTGSELEYADDETLKNAFESRK
ncbi:MAG: recombination mediator RecR [Candidatus Spechtbacterales bacterium]|nr:recombination mediator RecR [Candidatus Spechtbacterales bacterium]